MCHVQSSSQESFKKNNLQITKKVITKSANSWNIDVSSREIWICHITTECLLFFPDSLSLTALKYVILDWNWRDQKLRRLVDIPEVQRNNLLKQLPFIHKLEESGYLMFGSLGIHGTSLANSSPFQFCIFKTEGLHFLGLICQTES